MSVGQMSVSGTFIAMQHGDLCPTWSLAGTAALKTSVIPLFVSDDGSACNLVSHVHLFVTGYCDVMGTHYDSRSTTLRTVLSVIISCHAVTDLSC